MTFRHAAHAHQEKKTPPRGVNYSEPRVTPLHNGCCVDFLATARLSRAQGEAGHLYALYRIGSSRRKYGTVLTVRGVAGEEVD